MNSRTLFVDCRNFTSHLKDLDIRRYFAQVKKGADPALYFRASPSVRYLSLSGGGGGKDYLSGLEQCIAATKKPALVSLVLGKECKDKDALIRLSEHLPRLEKLELNRAPISFSILLKFVKNCPHLHTLTFAYEFNFKDPDYLTFLNSLPSRVKFLFIVSGQEVPPAAFKALSSLSHQWAQFHLASGLWNLSWNRLEGHLRVRNFHQIPSHLLFETLDFTKFDRLELSKGEFTDCKVVEKFFALMGKFKGLRWLAIIKCLGVTNDFLKKIAPFCKTVKQLNLTVSTSSGNYSVSGFSHFLAHCPSIQSLTCEVQDRVIYRTTTIGMRLGYASAVIDQGMSSREFFATLAPYQGLKTVELEGSVDPLHFINFLKKSAHLLQAVKVKTTITAALLTQLVSQAPTLKKMKIVDKETNELYKTRAAFSWDEESKSFEFELVQEFQFDMEILLPLLKQALHLTLHALDNQKTTTTYVLGLIKTLPQLRSIHLSYTNLLEFWKSGADEMIREIGPALGARLHTLNLSPNYVTKESLAILEKWSPNLPLNDLDRAVQSRQALKDKAEEKSTN